MTNDTNKLIDQTLINDANAKLAAAQERFAAADAALIPLQAFADAATQQAEMAIGSNDPEAMDLADAADLAARRLVVGTRIRDAAATAVQEARQGVKEATAMAAEPIRAHGLRMLMAASADHDAALAAVSAAEAKRKEAVRIVMVAHSQGLEAQALLTNIHAHVMQSGEMRRAYMVGNRIDPETGKLG